MIFYFVNIGCTVFRRILPVGSGLATGRRRQAWRCGGRGLPSLCGLLLLSLSGIAGAGEHAGVTLNDLMERAMTRHPSVLSMRELQGATEFDIQSAQQQFYPTPSISVNRDSRSYALQQPLWTGGVLTAQLANAHALHDVAGANLAETQDELALRVISAYGSWAQSLLRQDVTRELIRYYVALHAQISRRVDTGASSDVDQRLVASRLATVQADLVASVGTEQQAIAQLEQLSGGTLSKLELVSGLSTPGDLSPLGALLDHTAQRSPVLRRLSAEAESLRQSLAVQRAALLPHVYLTLQQVDSQTNFGMQRQRQVGLTMQWSPGAGLSSKTAADGAAARYHGAQTAAEAARTNLLERSRTDYEQYGIIRDRLAAVSGNLGDLKALRDSYFRQFLAGRKSWQEVMNSVREEGDALLSQADLRASLDTLAFKLNYLEAGVPAANYRQFGRETSP